MVWCSRSLPPTIMLLREKLSLSAAFDLLFISASRSLALLRLCSQFVCNKIAESNSEDRAESAHESARFVAKAPRAAQTRAFLAYFTPFASNLGHIPRLSPHLGDMASGPPGGAPPFGPQPGTGLLGLLCGVMERGRSSEQRMVVSFAQSAGCLDPSGRSAATRRA